MVYAERTDRYIAPKDSNNNTSTNKSNSSTSSSQTSGKFTPYGGSGSGSGSGSTATNSSWSKTASHDEKWKYNNMVRNDRDKFNGLHFS